MAHASVAQISPDCLFVALAPRIVEAVLVRSVRLGGADVGVT
jgi:hypothetical protein